MSAIIDAFLVLNGKSPEGVRWTLEADNGELLVFRRKGSHMAECFGRGDEGDILEAMNAELSADDRQAVAATLGDALVLATEYAGCDLELTVEFGSKWQLTEKQGAPIAAGEDIRSATPIILGAVHPTVEKFAHAVNEAWRSGNFRQLKRLIWIAEEARKRGHRRAGD